MLTKKALDKEKQLKRILKTSNESLTFIVFLQKNGNIEQ